MVEVLVVLLLALGQADHEGDGVAAGDERPEVNKLFYFSALLCHPCRFLPPEVLRHVLLHVPVDPDPCPALGLVQPGREGHQPPVREEEVSEHPADGDGAVGGDPGLAGQAGHLEKEKNETPVSLESNLIGYV